MELSVVAGAVGAAMAGLLSLSVLGRLSRRMSGAIPPTWWSDR